MSEQTKSQVDEGKEPRLSEASVTKDILVDAWQPIETAPKDKTRILLWWPHWNFRPVLGYYDQGWQAETALSDGPGPTHWMPLPAPPRSTSDGFGNPEGDNESSLPHQSGFSSERQDVCVKCGYSRDDEEHDDCEKTGGTCVFPSSPATEEGDSIAEPEGFRSRVFNRNNLILEDYYYLDKLLRAYRTPLPQPDQGETNEQG